jgi:hypothetical protein
MKKYIYIVLPILSLCLLFSACSLVKTNSGDVDLIKDCLTSYFSYYEKGDFDNMKQYCTDTFIDEYFHKNDVFGNASAKLIDFDDISYDDVKKQYIAEVNVECVPTENSSLYDKDNPTKTRTTYITFVLSVNNEKVQIESLTD